MTKDDLGEVSSPLKLLPLGDYRPPSMPTDESIRRLGWRVWKLWQSDKEDPFIANETLDLVDASHLDALVSPPAFGPVLTELTATLANASADEQASNMLQVIVLPPCEQNDLLGIWANPKGYQVIRAPNRDSIFTQNNQFAAVTAIEESLSHSASPNTVAVIPNLEDWFLRHPDGLGQVEQLLEVLANTKHRLIVGCSSWAWAFLRRATRASLVLPAPWTIAPFDAKRLYDWLIPLAVNGSGRSGVLRFVDSGKSVCGDDANDKKTHNFFEKLAARSRGIPWVAWHLWRQSLRTGPGEGKEGKQKFPTEQTIWVSGIKEFLLPDEEADAGLFILHSLLLHRRLNRSELLRTLPSVDHTNLRLGLVKAKFVIADNGTYCCSAAAYPAIREKLSASGFPLDSI